MDSAFPSGGKDVGSIPAGNAFSSCPRPPFFDYHKVMLYPISNEERLTISLDGMWEFRLDDGMHGEGFADTSFFRSSVLMPVPASYNDMKEMPEYRSHYGWAYYRRTFTIPLVMKGQRRILRFDAVTHQAKIYIDGTLVMEHKGGFLPFEVDITDIVEPGREAELIVACDNKVNHSTLPVGNEGGTAFFGSDNAGVPSVEAAKRWRKPQNLPNFDFFNYAGINRPVRIYTTPLSYIDDITLIPGIDGEDGTVGYSIDTIGDGSTSIEILDEDGKCVAKGDGGKGKLTIKNAELWWPYPGKPYLYTARVRHGDDIYTLSFGIRTVRVEGTRFLINGKPFYFKGFGKHEDSFIHGRGFDLALDAKDASLIHWINANSFRTSHYPYAEEMYELCDREGIVIIDETPAVGIGGSDKDPYTAFHIREHHEDVIRDLIRRDKNHPSVVMWSMGNEPDTVSFPESAYEYWHSLYEYTKPLDPQGRPVTFVCCQNDYTKDLVTRTMDVVCLNRYYGWYNLSGDLDAACYALSMELDFWEKQEKPVIFTEYGADTLPGYHLTVPEMFSEEFQVLYYERENAEFDKRSFVIGEHPWNFADFGTIQGPMRADGNRKGLFTRERRPKMIAHALRKRWGEIPDFGYKG